MLCRPLLQLAPYEAAYTAYVQDRHWLYLHSNSILLTFNRMHVFYSMVKLMLI